MGYDPEMGARPLKRVIQQKIEDSLSDAMLAGEFEDGDTAMTCNDPADMPVGTVIAVGTVMVGG